MAVLKKYNLAGQEVGHVAVEEALLAPAANAQMVKDYIVALRANARQWSANTKSRAEVNHSGKKPHPQKGTGRARQGYLGAPQYKGGGRVHAPKPKWDQHTRVNRKEKRAVIRHLLIEKILSNRVHVLQCEGMEAPRTKEMARFLQQLTLAGKRVLFLGYIKGLSEGAMLRDEKSQNLVLSMRNIPKTQFVTLPHINGYDVIVNQDLIVVESAVDQLKMLLGG